MTLASKAPDGVKALTKIGEHLDLAEGNPKATVESVARALFDGINSRRGTSSEEGEITENDNNDAQQNMAKDLMSTRRS